MILTRHALGVLGVLAAGVLLAVSAAMNWRFGFSLGKTELDGQIYGAASAAADCFKALIPFFLFAAIRNRMWSQAAASAVVWVVVTAYSLTSALGHAALNRFDTAGQRAVEAASYKDTRADLKRAQDQLSWIPQHRPAMTVQGDIDGVKNQRAWAGTKGCTEVAGRFNRDFCQHYHTLTAEFASGQQAQQLEARIADINGRLARSSGGTVLAEADPQAAVLAKLAGVLGFGLTAEDVQTALTLFVALLLEIGSGFGMYVAFSQWRLYDRAAPTEPRSVATASAPSREAGVDEVARADVAGRHAVVFEDHVPEAEVVVERAAPIEARPAAVANDNVGNALRVMRPISKLGVPESDVERFYRERVDTADGSSVTATTLYEDYCSWCEERHKEPLALPTFSRQFGDLGVQKGKIAGRVRYIGINLRSGRDGELDDGRRLRERPPQAA